MQALVDDWRKQLDDIFKVGHQQAIQKHLQRGKLLPRDRIALLLDSDSSFLEFSQFAAYQVYDDKLPAAGIITGIGCIAHRDCVIIANDATVKGGCYYPLTVKKHLRAQEIAETIIFPVFIWWTQAARSYQCKQMFFRIVIILGGYFLTRPICQRKAFLRLPWSWVPVLQGALMFRQ